MPQAPDTNPASAPFIELQSVDSTNNYARALIYDNLAQHGTAVFTHKQVAGKGQRGKTWLSEKDSNIILSIVLNPYPLQLSQQFQLEACVALAVHDFFTRYAEDNCKIKWPNDLYWQDRKAGGILIESVVGRGEWREVSGEKGDENPAFAEASAGKWKWAIVGVGININQTVFPSFLPNPVSLKQITGKNYPTIDLAKELNNMVQQYFQQLIKDGFDEIYARYISCLYKKGSTIRLRKGNRIFEAILKSVSPSGKLIAQHGIEEEFEFGQVEWLI